MRLHVCPAGHRQRTSLSSHCHNRARPVASARHVIREPRVPFTRASTSFLAFGKPIHIVHQIDEEEFSGQLVGKDGFTRKSNVRPPTRSGHVACDCRRSSCRKAASCRHQARCRHWATPEETGRSFKKDPTNLSSSAGAFPKTVCFG